jgi:hypothetical protein
MRIATHPEAIKHLVEIGMAADISEHIKMVESANESLIDEKDELRTVAEDNKRECEATRIENARLKAECQARQAENSVLEAENARLKAQVERLTFDPLTYLDDSGEWMPRHTHLAAVERLKAEVERLKAENEAVKLGNKEWRQVAIERGEMNAEDAGHIGLLQAHVERLTKAGDAMKFDCLDYLRELEKRPFWFPLLSELEVNHKSVQAWNAAKEGKQP